MEEKQLQKNRLVYLFVFTLILMLSFSSIAEARYARSVQTNNSYRGIKGDFNIPNIDAKWANNNGSFITFEEWITVNAAPDWFEIGYMDGHMDPEQDGVGYDYRGCFKAKQINGAYVEWPLDKAVSVGTRYTFTIVDFYANNLWELYIGSTYLGSFSDRVSPVDADYNYMGYEHNIPSGVTPTFGATNITNQYFRSQGQWTTWNNDEVWTEDTSSFVNPSWNSPANSTSFTVQ